MKAITKVLASAVALGAFAAAAPAAAQYYPGYGYGGYGGVVGSIINSVTRPYGGYGGYNNYGYNGYGYNVPGGSQVAVNQCSAAVQQRLGGGYGYGYGNYGSAVSIQSVELRSSGGYRVHGIAAAAGYGYGGGSIGFSCRTDPRGLVVSLDLGNRGYGYNNGYYGSNYADPYAAYGYHRY